MREWVFLSTHFDDVVLSVGGMIWELAHVGDKVSVWTVCAGDPPFGKALSEYALQLHGVWGIGDDVPIKRCQEDIDSCRVLMVSSTLRFTIPDIIYRYIPGKDEPVIKKNEDLKNPLEISETYLVPITADLLRKNLLKEQELVVPLSIGSHRDHVLTRKAAEMLEIQPWYYIDLPYMVKGDYSLSEWVPPQAEMFTVNISAEGLKAWQDSVACHRSQIPLLFSDEQDMRDSIIKFCLAGYGNKIWRF
jgi:2'-N-acetylparomamine deacetylase